MDWFRDQCFLESLRDSGSRQAWADKAKNAFYSHKKKFPADMREPNRVGTLLIMEIPGAKGLNCWLDPIDGHKKIIGPINEITLISMTGEIAYQGRLGLLPKEWLEAHTEFFLWFRPPHEAPSQKLSLAKRVQGIYRYWKNKN